MIINYNMENININDLIENNEIKEKLTLKEIELNNMINNNLTCIIEEIDLTKSSKAKILKKCEELGIIKCKSKNKCELIISLVGNDTSDTFIYC